MGTARDARLLVGPRGGVIATATLRDATGWDELVDDLGLAGLVRHSLRHTALPLMADVGVDLHILQRVAAHEGPAVTARYLHSRRTGQAGRWKCVSADGLWLVRSGSRSASSRAENAG